MITQNNTVSSSLLILFFIFLFTHHVRIQIPRCANARKDHISHDLDDDEDDDQLKNWGKNKPNPSSQFDLLKSPSDSETMEPSQVEAEMEKPQISPVIGFVKLGPDFPRSPDALFKTAVKWAELLLTGGIEVKFSGVNLSTMMFAIRSAGDVDEVKDFLLEQPEVYEIKIGDQIYGRPGDPSVEEILEKLRKDRENTNGAISNNDLKNEL